MKLILELKEKHEKDLLGKVFLDDYFNLKKIKFILNIKNLNYLTKLSFIKIIALFLNSPIYSASQ